MALTNSAQFPQPAAINQQAWKITTAMDGMFFECGAPGPGSTGTWTFQFAPDGGFNGSITVMARVAGQAGVLDGVPLEAIPYFARYLNGQIVGISGVLPGVYTTAQISGSTIAELSSGDLSLGFFVSIDAGTATMYLRDSET